MEEIGADGMEDDKEATSIRLVVIATRTLAQTKLTLIFPHSGLFTTPTGEEQQRRVRYVLGRDQGKKGPVTPYDKATPEKKKKLEREAVIAQIITGNMKRVCEERGIPLDVFKSLWEEYRETHMFDGRFFHRLEIPNTNETEHVKRMKKAIKEYHANGQRVRAKGMTNTKRIVRLFLTALWRPVTNTTLPKLLPQNKVSACVYRQTVKVILFLKILILI